MAAECVVAIYLIETAQPLAAVAEAPVGENNQAGLSWAVPREIGELRVRFQTRLENLKESNSAAASSFPRSQTTPSATRHGRRELRRCRWSARWCQDRRYAGLPPASQWWMARRLRLTAARSVAMFFTVFLKGSL